MTQEIATVSAIMAAADEYAEARHRQGHSTYNAATAAARQAVVDALSGVQALSAAPAIIREFESVLDEVDQLFTSSDCANMSAWHGRVARHVKDALSGARAMLAASPTPPALSAAPEKSEVQP